MDYSQLAVEMINKMHMLHKANPKKNIDESLHGEGYVLHYIAKQNGDVLPGEIGNDINVSTARIAQTLNNIEKKGWITRQIDTNDRRRIIIRLTPEGKDAADKFHQKLMGLATKMLNLLGEHDAKEYVRITGKLAEELSKNKHLFENATNS